MAKAKVSKTTESSKIDPPDDEGKFRSGDQTKGSELESERLDRQLRMLRECNRMLLRAENEVTALAETCRIIVEDGGYRQAWVGLA